MYRSSVALVYLPLGKRPIIRHIPQSLQYFWQYLVVSLLYRLVLYILEPDLGIPTFFELADERHPGTANPDIYLEALVSHW